MNSPVGELLSFMRLVWTLRGDGRKGGEKYFFRNPVRRDTINFLSVVRQGEEASRGNVDSLVKPSRGWAQLTSVRHSKEAQV